MFSYIDPSPLVEISTNKRPRMNKSLILTCDVFIARANANSVDIIWSISKNDRQIKRTSNVTLNKFSDTLALYSDSLIIPSLSLYDTENNYQCQVLINSTVVKENFTIVLPRMQIRNCDCLSKIQPNLRISLIIPSCNGMVKF